MKQEEIDNRLWDYIDGLCTVEEARQIALLLETDPAWRLRHEALLLLHQQVQQVTLAQPSLRFTQNIMDEIAALPTPVRANTRIYTWIIKGIAATMVLALLVITAYGFLRLDWLHTAVNNDYSLKASGLHRTGTHLIILANIIFLLLFIERLIRLRSRSFQKQ